MDAAGRQTAHWLKQLGADPYALLHVLDTHVETPLAELAKIDVPTLVAVGSEDHRNADGLAAALPNSSCRELPGDHWSAFTSPRFGSVLLDWFRNFSML